MERSGISGIAFFSLIASARTPSPTGLNLNAFLNFLSSNQPCADPRQGGEDRSLRAGIGSPLLQEQNELVMALTPILRKSNGDTFELSWCFHPLQKGSAFPKIREG